MIVVTERAREQLRKVLSGKADDPQTSIRLVATGSEKFSLGMDLKEPDDHVVKHESATVLLLAHDLAAKLEGRTLAFEDKKFVLAKGPLSGFNKCVVTLDLGKRR